MNFLRRASLFLTVVVLALRVVCPRELRAETLPERRPAQPGSGPGSLVNLIDVEALFQKGQRDAWVMFECGVAGDRIVFGSDFFTSSPDSRLLKNEVRRRLRQTRFIRAVYNHKRTEAWFAGTVVFVIAKGQPHLRLYANQDLVEIKRGADFVAPQLIFVQNHYISDLPNYPSAAKHAEVGAVLKLRHSVDVNGKTTGVEVMSEHPPGYGLGDYLKKRCRWSTFCPAIATGSRRRRVTRLLGGLDGRSDGEDGSALVRYPRLTKSVPLFARTDAWLGKMAGQAERGQTAKQLNGKATRTYY